MPRARRAIRLWAWLPKTMQSGKTIWLSHYYMVDMFTVTADPRHELYYAELFTEQEYFMYKLANQDVEEYKR